MLRLFSEVFNRADHFSVREGIHYLNSKRVINLVYLPGQIRAVVRGTRLYEVEVNFNGKASCSCPSYHFPCKHIIAVILTAQRKASQEEKQILTQQTALNSLQMVELLDDTAILKVLRKDKKKDGLHEALLTLEDKNSLHAAFINLGIRPDFENNHVIIDRKAFAQLLINLLNNQKNVLFGNIIAQNGLPFAYSKSTRPSLILAEENDRLFLSLALNGKAYPIEKKGFITAVSSSETDDDAWNFDPDEAVDESQIAGLFLADEKVVNLPQARLLLELSHFKSGSSQHAYFLFESKHNLSRDYQLDGIDQFSRPCLKKLTPSVTILLREECYKKNMSFLIVTLQFNYKNESLAFNKNLSPVIVIGSEYFRRDTDFEKQAARTLFDRIPPHESVAMPDFEALDFIFEKLPTLPPDWKIDRQLSVFDYSRDDRIKLELHAAEHEEWFDISFRISSDLRRALSGRMIRQILQKRPKYLRTDGGKWLQCSESLVNSISIAYFIGPHVLSSKKERISAFQIMGMWQYLQHEKSLTIPPRVTETINRLKSFKGIELPSLSDDLDRTLRPYQKEGVAWLEFLHNHSLSGILCDDMGLGKTLQTLVFLWGLKQKGELGQCVIVAPSSGVGAWQMEAEKFLPDLSIKVIEGNERGSIYEQWTKHELYIISYTLFSNDAERFQKLKINYLILDEAQFIKNSNSKRARAVFAVKSERRLALTGTPLENRLSELWSIFHFLMPGYLGSLEYFRDNFQKPVEQGGKVSALQALREKIKPFMLRRLKEKVEKELPPKTETPVFCDMTESQKKVYLHTLSLVREEVFENIAQKGVDKSYIHFFAALMKLRQVCNHPSLIFDKPDTKLTSGKFEAFKEQLLEITAEKHHALVFSQFTSMLAIVRRWLEEEKIPYLYLDGSTKDRQALVKEFEKGSHPIFLISLKAGGTALTLTRADYVIHYDPWWNPAVENQATDRAHRIGQTRHVFVYKFYCRGTVEEKILNLQKEKRKIFDAVMEGSLNTPFKLTRDEIENILTPNF